MTTSICSLDTQILLWLKELQELRNASTMDRQNYLRGAILNELGNPKVDMELDYCIVKRHPARTVTYKASMWIQNVDLNGIENELERRRELNV